MDYAIFDCLVLAGGVGAQLGDAASVGFGASVDAHGYQSREWWIADFVSIADLFGIECFVVVFGSQANCRMIGLKGL